MDDLDTPKMLARLWASLDALDEKLASGIRWFDEHVLKLGLFEADVKIEIPANIRDLVAKRLDAKKNKDFKLADMVRDELKTQNYFVEDYVDEN